MSFPKALMRCAIGTGLVFITGFGIGALPYVPDPTTAGLMVAVGFLLMALGLLLILGTVADLHEQVQRLKYR
jgi:hypothetical protein